MIKPNLNTDKKSNNYRDRYLPTVNHSYSKLAAAVLNLALQDSQDYRKLKNKNWQHRIDRDRADAKDFLEKEEYKEWRELLTGLAALWVEKTSPSGFIEPTSFRKRQTI